MSCIDRTVDLGSIDALLKAAEILEGNLSVKNLRKSKTSMNMNGYANNVALNVRSSVDSDTFARSAQDFNEFRVPKNDLFPSPCQGRHINTQLQKDRSRFLTALVCTQNDAQVRPALTLTLENSNEVEQHDSPHGNAVIGTKSADTTEGLMFGGQTTNWLRDAGSDPPRSFVHPSADRNCMFTAACGISRSTRPEDDDEPEALSNTSESDDVCMDSSSQDSLTGGTPVSLQRRLLRSTELSPAPGCEIPDSSAGSSSHCRLRTALLNSSRHFSAHSPTFEARTHPPPTALSTARNVHSLSPSSRTLVISRRASDRELQFYPNATNHLCPPEVPVSHSKEDSRLRSPPCSPDSAQADGVTSHKPLFYFNPSPENEMPSESESHPRPPSPSVGMRRIFSETCLEKAFPVVQPLSQPQSPGLHHRRSSLQLSSYRLPMKKRKLDWNIVDGNHTEASIRDSYVSSSCSSSKISELAFPALAKNTIKECSSTGPVTTQGAPNPLIIDRPVEISEGSQNGKTPSAPSIIMDSSHHHDSSSLSSSSEYVRCHSIPSGVNTYTVAKSSGNACDKGQSTSYTDGGATGNPSWNILSMPAVPKSTSSNVLHNSDDVSRADSAEMNDKNSNRSNLSVLARTLKAVDSERSARRNFGSFVSSSSMVSPSTQSPQFNRTLSRPEGSTAEELVRNLCGFGDSLLLSNLFASAACNLQSPQQTSSTHPSARPINGRSPKISPPRSFHQPSLKPEESPTLAGDAVSDMVRHLAYPNSINKSRNSVPPRLSRCNTTILEPTPLVTDPRLMKIKKRFSVGANLNRITTMPVPNAQQFSYLPNNGDRLSPSADFSRCQPDTINTSSNGSRAKTPLAFRPKFRITPPEEERDPLFDGGSFGTSIQPPIDCVSETGSSFKPSLKSRSSPQKSVNSTEKPQLIHAHMFQSKTEQTSTGAQILMMLSPTSPFAQVQSESNSCSAPLAIQLSASSIGNIAAENAEPDSASSLSKCSSTRSSFSHLGSSFPLLLVSASSSASAAALAAAAALATGAPPTSLVPVPVQLTSFIPAPSNSEENQNSNQPSDQLKSQFPQQQQQQQQRIVLSLCTTTEHEPISRRLPPSASVSDRSQPAAPTRPSP